MYHVPSLSGHTVTTQQYPTTTDYRQSVAFAALCYQHNLTALRLALASSAGWKALISTLRYNIDFTTCSRYLRG